MKSEDFKKAYEVQQEILNLKGLKSNTEKSIERAFPSSYSYGDDEPFGWDLTNNFRKRMSNEFNREIDKLIKNCEEQFEKL